MSEVIEETMKKVSFDASPDLDVYMDTDRVARIVASEMI